MASLECREGMALLVSKINRKLQGLRLILMPFTLREDSDYLHMRAVSGSHGCIPFTAASHFVC